MPELPVPDWYVSDELVCLTCAANPDTIRRAVLARGEQVSLNHDRHLIIVAKVFNWL